MNGRFPRNPGWLWLVAAALVATSHAHTPLPASAHADYERSNPPANGVINRAPARLDVWFTQELFRRAGANTLTVTGPAGDRVDSGDTALDDADRKHLSLGLKPNLPDGVYAVAWASLSAVDGDNASGAFTFRIDSAAASPTPAASPVPATFNSPTTTGGAFPLPLWSLIAAAAILLSGAIASWAILRPEPGADR